MKLDDFIDPKDPDWMKKAAKIIAFVIVALLALACAFVVFMVILKAGLWLLEL